MGRRPELPIGSVAGADSATPTPQAPQGLLHRWRAKFNAQREVRKEIQRQKHDAEKRLKTVPYEQELHISIGKLLTSIQTPQSEKNNEDLATKPIRTATALISDILRAGGHEGSYEGKDPNLTRTVRMWTGKRRIDPVDIQTELITIHAAGGGTNQLSETHNSETTVDNPTDPTSPFRLIVRKLGIHGDKAYLIERKVTHENTPQLVGEDGMPLGVGSRYYRIGALTRVKGTDGQNQDIVVNPIYLDGSGRMLHTSPPQQAQANS